MGGRLTSHSISVLLPKYVDTLLVLLEECDRTNPPPSPKKTTLVSDGRNVAKFLMLFGGVFLALVAGGDSKSLRNIMAKGAVCMAMVGPHGYPAGDPSLSELGQSPLKMEHPGHPENQNPKLSNDSECQIVYIYLSICI